MTFRILGTAFTFLFSCLAVQAQTGVERVTATSTTPSHWSHLPILGEKAAERGYKLPSPIGVGLYFNNQSMSYDATSDFNIGAHGGLFGGASIMLPQNDVEITGKDQSVQLRVDAWLLPFLNVYGLVGHTRGNKDIVANTAGVQVSGLGMGGIAGDKDRDEEAANLLRAMGSIEIPIEYEAVNIGLGGVLAGQVDPFGWHPFIMTLVGAYTVANTTATDSKIYTTVGAFKVGQRYDVPGGKLAGLLGVTYQKVDQNMSGSYNLMGTKLGGLMNSVDYDVSLENSENINMAVTLLYDFGPGENWNVMMEYGFLNWNQLTVALGRRF